MDNDWNPVYRDEDGGRYQLTESGKRIPMEQAEPIKSSSGFTTYDTSEGHCAFCGSLFCRGGCFK